MGFNNGPVLLAAKQRRPINSFHYEQFHYLQGLNFQVVVGYCYILFEFFQFRHDPRSKHNWRKSDRS